MANNPVAAGKSSFDLIDGQKTFELMDVQINSTMLDLACGVGLYSIEIAKRTGEKGVVHAFDLWQEGVETLNAEILRENIKNIRAKVADISKKLPLEAESIDSCLMATIIHDLSETQQNSALEEVARLIKPGGMLNIIEFKKIDKGPGPPIHIRMDEADIEKLVTPYGFKKVMSSSIGEFNYLLKFTKNT